MFDTTPISRFEVAMRSVYGDFETLSPEQVASWTPPSDPGAGGHRGRYLWTDAFGVINFLTLFQETTISRYLVLATRLVETVHNVLGKTRDGSSRLPGATDEHPLKGGLRIGKMAESGPDGDGQYHHYLTLWMFALNRLSLATKEPKYNDLAMELAKAIHHHFIRKEPGRHIRMVWKISMDMSHALVHSEGHLDAATGYVMCRILQQTAILQGHNSPLMEQEIADYLALIRRKPQTMSKDTLDLGMGLWMCHLVRDEAWAVQLANEGLKMAQSIFQDKDSVIHRPASRRLAFREFGTCLGILCFDPDTSLRSKIDGLLAFWEANLQNHPEEDLRPISRVMFAAAIIPGAFREGYLDDALEPEAVSD